MGLESSWLDRQGQGFVAGFTLFQTRIKGLTRSSGFQKLENSNLEILKFEARATHSSGQILSGFLRLSFHQFVPDDSLG